MKKKYILENLECANCAAIMEEKILKLDGVKSVNINFFTTKMTLEFDDDLESEILNEVQKIITKLEPNTKVII